MCPEVTPQPEILDVLSAELYENLVNCDRAEVERIMARALELMPAIACTENLLGPTLNRIGQAWNDGTVALSQLYLSSRICEDQMEKLLPVDGKLRPDQPRLGIAVLADFHALGKRIVLAHLRAGGYQVTDYGLGIDPAPLAAKVKADNLDAILVSTLMLPAALQVKKLCTLLKDHPVKVFVGGAPFQFDPELWQEVGAHAMGPNAAAALGLVESLGKEQS